MTGTSMTMDILTFIKELKEIIASLQVAAADLVTSIKEDIVQEETRLAN